MSIADYFAMFFASFTVVFLLGLQSKNVNQSRYFAAILTSFGISASNFTFVKYASNGNSTAFWVCAAGGCLGIAFSIWFYDNILHTRRIAPGSTNTPKGGVGVIEGELERYGIPAPAPKGN